MNRDNTTLNPINHISSDEDLGKENNSYEANKKLYYDVLKPMSQIIEEKLRNK